MAAITMSINPGAKAIFWRPAFRRARRILSIFIMPGYAKFDSLLARLGKHKTGVSCLYVKKLADIDEAILRELIRAGLRDLNEHWPVKPT